MLNLDYRDARPIYEQVRDNLRRLMVSGAIQEGEKLPSVRSLASNLAINPNTIQRAYESLEAEGYVYSIPGKGSFAAPRTGVDEERRDRLLGQFDSLTAELLYLGVTRDRLMEEYDAQYPQYGFAVHKGYGTKRHYEALREFGPSPIHRKTFLKKFYENP